MVPKPWAQLAVSSSARCTPAAPLTLNPVPGGLAAGRGLVAMAQVSASRSQVSAGGPLCGNMATVSSTGSVVTSGWTRPACWSQCGFLSARSPVPCTDPQREARGRLPPGPGAQGHRSQGLARASPPSQQGARRTPPAGTWGPPRPRQQPYRRGAGLQSLRKGEFSCKTEPSGWATGWDHGPAAHWAPPARPTDRSEAARPMGGPSGASLSTSLLQTAITLIIITTSARDHPQGGLSPQGSGCPRAGRAPPGRGQGRPCP